MIQPTLEILSGPIGSGKSTHARQQAQNGAIIIDPDTIITSIHTNYSMYNPKLKPLYKSIEETTISTALAMGLDVVIDRCNNTKSSRTRYASLGRARDVKVVLIKFPPISPDMSAERRASDDLRGIEKSRWEEIARQHALEREQIDEDELYLYDEIIEYASQPTLFEKV